MGRGESLKTKNQEVELSNSDRKYQPELDELIWEKEVDISNPLGKSATKFKFLVRVMIYDDGQPKLEIKRLMYGRFQEGRYLKTGRLNKHELEELMPVIHEAMEKM